MHVIDEMKAKDNAGDTLIGAPTPTAPIVVSMDPSGIIVGVNSPGLSVFESLSSEPVYGKRLTEIPALESTELPENIRKCMAASTPGSFEAYLRTSWGHEIHVQCQISPLQNAEGHILSYQLIMDPLDKKKAAAPQTAPIVNPEYVTRVRKMAHDFNNILSGVLGYAELAMFGTESSSEAQENLRECINSALRAKTLVTEMIELNRQTFGKRS